MMDFQSNADKNPEDGWLSWAKYVLKTLQSHEDTLKDIKKQEFIDNIEFERFKTKVETRSSSISAIVAIVLSAVINIMVAILTK